MNILKDWKITNKLIAVVPDNARNCAGIGQYLTTQLQSAINATALTQQTQSAQRTPLYHVSYNAHVLNLVVQHIEKALETKAGEITVPVSTEDGQVDELTFTAPDLEQAASYRLLVAKCRGVATAIHHSNVLSDMLTKK